ncbi:hypothetical protein BIFDEN_00262 [Bifidobacterium dentium ATCC 27678]|nr:hypothetical protein BIFDEN_00262 [Bifidobacterium dentium ATCC 27678]
MHSRICIWKLELSIIIGITLDWLFCSAAAYAHQAENTTEDRKYTLGKQR